MIPDVAGGYSLGWALFSTAMLLLLAIVIAGFHKRGGLIVYSDVSTQKGHCRDPCAAP